MGCGASRPSPRAPDTPQQAQPAPPVQQREREAAPQPVAAAPIPPPTSTTMATPPAAAGAGAGAGTAAAAAAGAAPREKERLTATTTGSAVVEGKLLGDASLPVRDYGADFVRAETVGVPFVQERIRVYEEIKARRAAELADAVAYPREAITVKLLCAAPLAGVEVQATSWSSLPIQLGKSLAGKEEQDAFKAVAKDAVVAKVYYTSRVGAVTRLADGSGVAEEEAKDDGSAGTAAAAPKKGQLWDLLRPLEGSCEIEFLTFDDPEGRAVFWHSSAHVLGECLECGWGCHLTVGPPIQSGFFYDAYMGTRVVDEDMKRDLEAKAKQVCTVKQAGLQQGGQGFERLVLSKEEALQLFAGNPFKVAMIRGKIPDGGFTTAYRCGPMIDLCMGPHVPNTRAIKAFAVLSASSTYFAGKSDHDALQRVYGVSFPSEERLAQHLSDLREAKENDHRQRGRELELFFFHPLSPGSAFFEPAGARLYNTLIAFIRAEYRVRGYSEVVTPNIFHVGLWKISEHWNHYKENMFSFTDGEELAPGANPADADAHLFALKPMNCPGHCLVFAHRERSYRDLPLRMADFGVLHRNELSGALTGLTRVRRFQQDDAHIFCTRSQMKQEVLGALHFMKFVYSTFGMTYRLERSTRPAKATGLDTAEGRALWDEAEAALADAMDEFQGPGTWRDNPGDGAFYGPKIDIKVFDAQHRTHQCATIQLDFQLPRKFKLQYTAETGALDHPVMVHRAMLGSLERMIAILVEHFRGRFPFWLAPRQIMVVPMLAGTADQQAENAAYARRVAARLAEFFVDVPTGANDHHNDAMKKAFERGYKFVLCVGPAEVKDERVSVEGRHPYGSKEQGPLHFGTCPLEEAVRWFRAQRDERLRDEELSRAGFTPDFARMTHKKHGERAKEGPAPASASAPAQEDEVAKAGGKRKLPREAEGASPAMASSSRSSYLVGDEEFPTHVKVLVGRRFPDVAAYVAFLKEAGKQA